MPLGGGAIHTIIACRHARTIDRLAVGLGDAGRAEFIDARGEGGRTRIHRRDHPERHQRDREHPAFADLGDRILAALAVRLGRGRGEDHLRRHIGDGVEERIGCQIVTQPPARADPGDGPRRDDGVERIMGQAMALGRAIEHGAVL